MELREITLSNVDDVLDLQVFDEQKEFVASNYDSIATAYAANNTKGVIAKPFALYEDNVLVGFMMIGYNVCEENNYEDIPLAKNNYLLWRLMIDKRYQRQGYGRKAMQLFIDFVSLQPYGKAECMFTSYEPDNTVAAKLYHDFGFVDTGEIDCGEYVTKKNF